jgi:hypothetical protein
VKDARRVEEWRELGPCGAEHNGDRSVIRRKLLVVGNERGVEPRGWVDVLEQGGCLAYAFDSPRNAARQAAVIAGSKQLSAEGVGA